MFKPSLIIALFAATLTACSGGSSTTSTQNDMHGIWNGTVTNDGTTENSIAFISQSGEAFILTGDDEVFAGRVSTNNTTFNGTGTAYYPGDTQNGTITGTFSHFSTITGTSNGGATFNYTFDDSYQRASSLATIAGTYSETTGTYTETYTIDSNGDLSGSDTDGCIFGGTVTTINTDFNLYDIRFTIDNCDELNGNYYGLLALTDDTEPGDTLAIMVEGREYLLAGTIPKV